MQQLVYAYMCIYIPNLVWRDIEHLTFPVETCRDFSSKEWSETMIYAYVI